MTPVWPNLPTTEAFLPAVALLVAVFPALVAVFYGELSPNSAFWGRCGQDVLAGDLWLIREDQATPPLFPWFVALTMAIGIEDPIWNLTIPSYLFWLLSAAVIHQLVRCWFDSNTALLTCLLLAVNPALIDQVQHGMPGPCVLFWWVLGLWAFVEHARAARGYPWLWVVLGGVALGGLVLASGPPAIWLPVLTTLHLSLEQLRRREAVASSVERFFFHPTLRAGLAVLIIAVLIAGRWIWLVAFSAGPLPTFTRPAALAANVTVAEIVLVMPCTVVFALLGLVLAAFRLALSARMRIHRVRPERQSSMPVLWALTALIAFAFADRSESGLLLAATPLTLLAVRSLELVVNRRLRDRGSYWLMLVTYWVFVLSRSPALVTSTRDLLSNWLTNELPSAAAGRRLESGWRLFEIHLAFDAILAGSVLLAWLYRISGRRDRYRRLLFGGFAATVVLASILLTAAGLVGSGRGSGPWRSFYQSLCDGRPYDWYALVGDGPAPDEVEFIARSVAPTGDRLVRTSLQDLDAAFDMYRGRPLVVLFNANRSRPISIVFSKGAATDKLDLIFEDSSVVAYAIRKPPASANETVRP